MKLIHAIVYSNVFIALSGVGLKLFCFPETNRLQLVVLFASIVWVYSLLKWTGRNKQFYTNTSSAAAWLQNNSKLQWLILIGVSALGLYAWYQLDFFLPVQWYFALALLLLYAILRLTGMLKNKWRLLAAFLKIAIVAVVWALMLLSIPNGQFPWQLFCVLFFYLLALMIPFEIKDMKHDQPFQVPTIPLCIGLKGAKMLSVLCLLVAMWCMHCTNLDIVHQCIFSFTLLLAIVLVYLSSEQRTDLFFYLAVDGLLLLPFVLLCFYTYFLRYIV